MKQITGDQEKMKTLKNLPPLPKKIEKITPEWWDDKGSWIRYGETFIILHPDYAPHVLADEERGIWTEITISPTSPINNPAFTHGTFDVPETKTKLTTGKGIDLEDLSLTTGIPKDWLDENKEKTSFTPKEIPDHLRVISDARTGTPRIDWSSANPTYKPGDRVKMSNGEEAIVAGTPEAPPITLFQVDMTFCGFKFFVQCETKEDLEIVSKEISALAALQCPFDAPQKRVVKWHPPKLFTASVSLAYTDL